MTTHVFEMATHLSNGGTFHRYDVPEQKLCLMIKDVTFLGKLLCHPKLHIREGQDVDVIPYLVSGEVAYYLDRLRHTYVHKDHMMWSMMIDNLYDIFIRVYPHGL